MGSFSTVVRWYLAGCLARCGGSRFHFIGYIELTNSGRDGIVGGGRKAGKPTKRRRGGVAKALLEPRKLNLFPKFKLNWAWRQPSQLDNYYTAPATPHGEHPLETLETAAER